MAVLTADAIPQLQKISNSKVLVAGAGQIGGKILENLAMNGFEDIEIVSIVIVSSLKFYVLLGYMVFYQLIPNCNSIW